MKKLLQNIGVLKKEQKPEYSGLTLEQKAVSRYCEICDTGFRTPQAKSSHVAIRHKKYGR